MGEPLVGKTHDIAALRETGLAEFLDQHIIDHLIIGALGYLGEPVVTSVKKLSGGKLSPAQKETNKQLRLAAVTALEFYRLNWIDPE